MVKRGVTALLWFIAVDSAFNLMGLLVSTPPILGVVVALGAAAFVGVDPFRVVWSARKVEAKTSPAVPASAQRPVHSNS